VNVFGVDSNFLDLDVDVFGSLSYHLFTSVGDLWGKDWRSVLCTEYQVVGQHGYGMSIAAETRS